MNSEKPDRFYVGGTMVKTDLMPLFWSVIFVGAFVFSRGCDGEKSPLDRYFEAAYPASSVSHAPGGK